MADEPEWFAEHDPSPIWFCKPEEDWHLWVMMFCPPIRWEAINLKTLGCATGTASSLEEGQRLALEAYRAAKEKGAT